MSTSDHEANDEPDAPESLDQQLRDAMARPVPSRTANRHGGGIETATRPQKFVCDDGLYAVKFKDNQHGDGRGIFNEQVVGTLGSLLGAPVAPVALVNIPQALVDELNANATQHHLNFLASAGIHHGSRWQDDHSGRQAISHVDENRERFGALDVLHAWTGCSGDQQWIYANDPPHAVLSTDHTTFFPDGFIWTASTVAAHHNDVAADAVFQNINLTPVDRAAALSRLEAVTTEQVIAAVAAPPVDWDIPADDRLALAEFLLARKDGVLALLS